MKGAAKHAVGRGDGSDPAWSTRPRFPPGGRDLCRPGVGRSRRGAVKIITPSRLTSTLKRGGWPDLDSHQDVAVPDHFDEGHAVVGVLVQGLVEEDHPAEAAVDAIVRAEEDLPELPAVLLRVVHPHLGQTLAHAACGEAQDQEVSVRWGGGGGAGEEGVAGGWEVYGRELGERGRELQTDRLVCSEDALPWRNDTQGCLMELPLLSLRERGDLVCHPGGLTAFG